MKGVAGVYDEKVEPASKTPLLATAFPLPPSFLPPPCLWGDRMSSRGLRTTFLSASLVDLSVRCPAMQFDKVTGVAEEALERAGLPPPPSSRAPRDASDYQKIYPPWVAFDRKVGKRTSRSLEIAPSCIVAGHECMVGAGSSE